MRAVALVSLLVLASGNLLSQQVTVKVTNPSTFPREGETIEVAWNEIARHASGLRPEEVSVRNGSTRLVSQSVDDDGDGKLDLLIFQSSFTAGETKGFALRAGGKNDAETSHVDARFVLPREDLAWENDRVAFRIYGSKLAGDVRNGIDVWTKRVRSLVVEKWYRESEGSAPGKDSYHVDRGEGADFFAVGRSLGAGSSGVWLDGELFQSGLFTSHKIVANGPIRTVFEVLHDNGTIRGTPFVERKRISLDAGQNLNRIEVSYGDVPQASVVALGLVKRKNTVRFGGSDASWLSLWGPTNDDPVNEFLGTGIVVTPSARLGAAEDRSHYLLLADPGKGRKVIYYAGAGWTRSGDFKTDESWNSYLASWSLRLQRGLHIELTH